MKTIEQSKFQSDKSNFENIIKVLKSDNEVKIEKTTLDRFLWYIETQKIDKYALTILYTSDSSKVVLINSEFYQKKSKNEPSKDLVFDFKPFGLKCFSVGCIHNKYEKNTYTCTKETIYHKCANKKTDPKFESEV